MTRHTIPFTISHMQNGFSQENGLLQIRNDELLFEFEKVDTATGLPKFGTSEIHVPFSEIESIIFRKKWIGAVVDVATKSIKALEDVPGASQGRCTLQIKRTDRARAEKNISTARLWLSEYRLKELGE